MTMCDLRNMTQGGLSAGQKLFFNERDSDVSIRVEWDGGRWHFPGHQLVLGTMSEVLRTMLDSDMLEGRSRVLTIKDSDPQAVKHFLRYLYMGVVEFNGWKEATRLLKIAHKYAVQTLVHLSESYLSTTLVISNACTLHDLARVYSLTILKKQTQLQVIPSKNGNSDWVQSEKDRLLESNKVFILDAGFVVSASEGFFDLRSKSLECILSSIHFNVEDEGSVLSCLREWAVCECSRRCMPLSRANVLATMEPFFKYIHWKLILEAHRTFVPRNLVEKYLNPELSPRKQFHVPPSIQYHMSFVKFVVELGVYHCREEGWPQQQLDCLKFSVSNHTFLVGFRIIGLFKINNCMFPGPSSLALSKADNKIFLQFNLNSLTWTKGSSVGRDIWREMIAYLPYPVRVDPFGTYNLSIRCGSRSSKEITYVKWPRTRLDSEIISTDLGAINFRVYEQCYGITQLFVLPAPPYRSICNHGYD